MKKFLFLLLMLFPLAMSAKDVKIKINTDGNLVERFTDDVISVRFYNGYDSPWFIMVEVTNQTKERIEIEWENAKFQSERILFGDDTGLTEKNQRPNEVVFGGDISKKEFSSKAFYNEHRELFEKIYTAKEIKKNGSLKRTVIIPIKYNDKVTDYRFELEFVIE